MRNIVRIGTGSPNVYRLPVQQREIGSQITEWSCIPASMEYLSYFNMGRTQTPLIQESFTTCANWMTQPANNQNVERVLMPWDPISWISILTQFQMRLEAIVVITNEDQIHNGLASYLNNNRNDVGFVLQSQNLFGQAGHGHSMAIESADNNFCRLISSVTPSGNNVSEPEWGDFTWNTIWSWFSQILVLRKI